jgi:hypothetical protein
MSTQALHFLAVVLNAYAVTDVAQSGHVLQITDCPDMDLRTLNVPLGTFAPSLVSNPSSFEVTWTVLNSTFYQVRIDQTFVGQGTTSEVFEFTSDTTATDIEISNAFRAMIALNQNLSVTLNTAGSATLEVTASGVDSALITLTVVTANGTVASLQDEILAGFIDGTVTPHLVTGVIPASVVEGSTVTIVDATTAAEDGNYRVGTVVAGVSAQLFGTVANIPVGITNADVLTSLTNVAQMQRGAGQQLIDAGVTDAVAGNTYTSWTFLASNVDPTSSQGSEISAATQITLYVNEGDAQFAAFQSALIVILQAENVIA